MFLAQDSGATGQWGHYGPSRRKDAIVKQILVALAAVYDVFDENLGTRIAASQHRGPPNNTKSSDLLTEHAKVVDQSEPRLICV